MRAVAAIDKQSEPCAFSGFKYMNACPTTEDESRATPDQIEEYDRLVIEEMFSRQTLEYGDISTPFCRAESSRILAGYNLCDEFGSTLLADFLSGRVSRDLSLLSMADVSCLKCKSQCYNFGYRITKVVGIVKTFFCASCREIFSHPIQLNKDGSNALPIAHCIKCRGPVKRSGFLPYYSVSGPMQRFKCNRCGDLFSNPIRTVSKASKTKIAGIPQPQRRGHKTIADKMNKYQRRARRMSAEGRCQCCGKICAPFALCEYHRKYKSENSKKNRDKKRGMVLAYSEHHINHT